MKFTSHYGVFMLAWACTWACFGANAQSSRGPSTPQERERVLAMIDDLEANPLGTSAKQERNQLAMFLLGVPDLHVGMCSGLLGDLSKQPGKDYDILVMQPSFSSTRYAIQHGGGDGRSVEQYQAGVLGALKTYENMVKVKPADRQPVLDDLLKKRANGTLAAYVKARVATACKVKGT